MADYASLKVYAFMSPSAEQTIYTIFTRNYCSIIIHYHNYYPKIIHVISPDFGGSSRFGAFPPGLTLGRRNLPTRGFFQFHFSRTVFLSEHFIVYGSIYLANKLFTAEKCLTFIDLIDDH